MESVMSRIVFIIFLAFIFSFSNLNAYIDPGSGSYILQLLIAGALGGVYAIKVFWSQIKSFCYSLFAKKKK